MSCLRRVWLLNRTLSWKHHFTTSKRQLYSSSYLGLDTFMENRKFGDPNSPVAKKQVERLKQLCYTDNVIFLDDIRKILNVAYADEDINILISMLKKYASQRKDIQFHTYNFGTEVMRLLYIMNKPDEALILIKDDNLFGYFQHFTSVLLLLDLLFEKYRYNDVISTFKYCTERKEELKQGQDIVLLLLAACYKSESLDESDFQLAYDVYMPLRTSFGSSLRNSVMFAALLLKRNNPLLAVEAFYGSKLSSVAENYRIMAYAQAKRIDSVLQLMQGILHKERRIFLTMEALSFIEKEVSNSSEENIVDFQNLRRELEVRKLITDEPLEKLLFQTIDVNKRSVNPPGRLTVANRFSKNRLSSLGMQAGTSE